MTERKGSTYGFPLGRKGYRTKTQIIELIQKCQGKPKTKGDEDNFDYLDDDDLYSLKLRELKDHVNTMVSRDSGTFKYALSQLNKEGLIDLIVGCQGQKAPVKQSGGRLTKEYRRKGYGWGFSF